MKDQEFQPLELPRKGLPPSNNQYRVYKDEKEFNIVEAASALEALKASGLQKAHRIQRESILEHTLIDLKKLGVTEGTPSGTEDIKPPGETSVPAAAEAKPADGEKPLTGEQVDKLMSEKPEPKAGA